MLWPGLEGWRKSWWGKALGYDGDGHMAVMEHEAGIEWVTGHRLESGHKSGFGY